MEALPPTIYYYFSGDLYSIVGLAVKVLVLVFAGLSFGEKNDLFCEKKKSLKMMLLLLFSQSFCELLNDRRQ